MIFALIRVDGPLARSFALALCLAASLAPCAWADKPALPRPVAEPVVVIRLEGEIDSLFRAFLVRQLDVAKGMGAKTVIPRDRESWRPRRQHPGLRPPPAQARLGAYHRLRCPSMP